MARPNAAWHQTHPMPRNATMDQRVKWHLAHAKACECRDIPKTVITELKARGVVVPRRSARTLNHDG
jgi:hypothetical protein